MDEKAIRELPTEQLVKIRNQIKEVDLMKTFSARMSTLESAVAKLIAMAEEEEEKKVPYAGEEEQEEKKVPVTRVTAEEEEKPEEEREEEKEEKMKAEEEEEAGKQLAELEAKVNELSKLLMKKKAYVADDGAITPETPEDEPAMKKVSIPPVKSGHVAPPAGEVEDPKRSKVKIFETPSMKPGAKSMKVGKASSQKVEFNAQKVDAMDIALDEIGSFAASRGTVPAVPGKMARVSRV